MKRYCVVAMLTLCIGALPAFSSEEQTLQFLSHQTFLQLHDEYVALPDHSTERVARSAQSLPPGWPVGELKGLVLKQYLDEAFQTAGLAAIDAGMWFEFRDVDGEADVVLFVQRNTYGQINIKVVQAFSAANFLRLAGTMLPLACGDDDNFGCSCGGSNCDDACTGPGSSTWVNTGETSQETGNEIYENPSNGSTAERCGDNNSGDDGDDGPVIILAPM